MTMNERCYVLNGKGTGKTRTALWAWDYLRGNNFSNKMLVIAPLSTLKFTWAHECIRTLPHRKYAVLHGSKSKRLALLADPEIEVFFINHDGIKVIFDELMHHKEIDTLCIDELAVYRNSSDRTKAARKLAKKMKFVWGMTGDPMPHEVTDVWGQCTVVTPHTVPERFNRFRDDLMYRPNANALFTWVPRVDAVERAYACMQPAVRFSLDDVTELPDLVERWVDVEISPKQLKAYEDIRKHCVALIGANQITAVNAGVALNKLLQVSAGWVYTSDGQIVPLDNDVRQQTMLDDINGAANKVLVFAPYKHCLAGISDVLTKDKIEHAVVSGDTPLSERSEIFTAFQHSSKYKVIAAHPQCLAHGITLTNADTILWFGPITSNETYSQANARIRRVGQKHKQLVLHYQGTAVERKVYKMLRDQQSVQQAFLELFEEATPTQNH